MSYALNKVKDSSTQAVIDELKMVNFSKIPQVMFINSHSSCPDHENGSFIYKGVSALTLARQPNVKHLANEQGVIFACTCKQWKYVPKDCPIMNVRFSKATGQVHSVPLYSYYSDKEAQLVTNFNIANVVLSHLSKAEVDFVWDFIDWRLGEQPSAKNHRLGFQKIYELSALADSFIEHQIIKIAPKKAV